jgi:hypothetical protein
MSTAVHLERRTRVCAWTLSSSNTKRCDVIKVALTRNETGVSLGCVKEAYSQIIGEWFSEAATLIFFNLCGGTSGTAATYWPIVPAPVLIVEKLVEWRSARETEVLGENLPQRLFVHHKSHMTRPGFEPGPPRWEAID